MRRTLETLVALLTLALAAACETPPAETPADDTPAVDTPAAPPPAASKVNNGCVGEIGDEATVKVEAGKNGKVVIGALTDIKEGTEENVKNLEALLGWFKKQKVDVIVLAGDSGMDQGDIEKVVGMVAGAGVPVFNIIGNREGQKDYAAAMAALTAKHENVHDLNRVRRVDLGAADIVSLPGYFNESYIHAEDGCGYAKGDVAALGGLVDAADSPVVLVSHGGPKQGSEHGIDRTAEGENVGDPDLAQLIKDKKIPFGIFGNIHEAGGRATDLEGTKVLDQKKAHDSLYLNPGPADGVRWVMNDKTESIGMGSTLTIDGGKGSYEVFRVSEPGAKKKKKKKK